MGPLPAAATVGVGVDVLHIARIRQILQGPSQHTFIRRTFTAAEIAASGDGPDRSRALAMRFACKEAVFKSLSTSWVDGDEFLHFETTLRPGAAPQVDLGGRFRRYAEERGITRIALSISEDADLVVAVAVALSDGAGLLPGDGGDRSGAAIV